MPPREPPAALTPERVAVCQELLGYRFQNPALLTWCLTHASASRTRLESNERLEFLGDAVLGLIVCQLLFERFPDSSEGDLTRIKSAVVARTSCAQIAINIGLPAFLILGRGIMKHGHVPGSVLAASVESLIGGIYRESGLTAAREFVERHFAAAIERAVEIEGSANYKSLLQHLAQRSQGATPQYVVVDEYGPDHKKHFLVHAIVCSRQFSPAWGDSKKSAEQRAAQNALAEIDGQAPPHSAVRSANCATDSVVGALPRPAAWSEALEAAEVEAESAVAACLPCGCLSHSRSILTITTAPHGDPEDGGGLASGLLLVDDSVG